MVLLGASWHFLVFGFGGLSCQGYLATFWSVPHSWFVTVIATKKISTYSTSILKDVATRQINERLLKVLKMILMKKGTKHWSIYGRPSISRSGRDFASQFKQYYHWNFGLQKAGYTSASCVNNWTKTHSTAIFHYNGWDLCLPTWACIKIRGQGMV